MKDRPKLIGALLRPEDEDFGRAFAIAIRDRGHAIEVARSGEELFVGAPYDLVIVDAQLPGQWSGLALLEALSTNGETPLAILVGEELGAAAFRVALRLGVRDLVPHPLDACVLMESVERALEEACPSRQDFARSLPAIDASIETGSRALGAFLLERGVQPSHRVRITTALAEILQLAGRGSDAAATQGRVAVHARTDTDAVRVEVESQASSLASLAVVPAALPGFPVLEDELWRVRQLCEAIDIHPTPSGSRIVLSFALTPVRFAEEGDELAELDFLHPDTTRSWLSALARADGGTVVPPSLTTTLGRLLDHREVNEEALAALRR